MERQHVSLRDTISINEGTRVSIKSFDLNLPHIKEKGSSLADIQRHVLTDSINVYPPNVKFGIHDTKHILLQRIQGLSRNGLAYVATNLSVSADISKPKPEPQPDDVILDVCLLVEGFPPTVFTLVKDGSASLDMTRSYNLRLVQGVIRAVRRFTTDQFSAVYGLVEENHLNSQENFQGCLDALLQKTSRKSNPNSLKMSEARCRNIIHAFLSSVALSHSVVNDDNSDTLWFLTLEQFCILTENIDQREVIVRTAPSSGGKVLLQETARRLEKSGPTLLVMKSEEEIQVARDQNTCSVMLTLEEWRARHTKGDHPKGITNLVTNCQNCPTISGLEGKCWTFFREPSTANVTIRPLGRGARQREDTEGQSTDESSPGEALSHKELIEIYRQLKSETSTKDDRIQELMEENTTLRQTEQELTRMLDSGSLGGLSLDSGHGSDVSSLASWRSTLSLNPQGATGGQRETRGLLKNIKKRLTLGKPKTLDYFPDYFPDYWCAIYNEDKTAYITLQCRQQEMDRERTNTEKCHVTKDGRLVNTKPTSRIQQGRRRFKEYWGTCSTSPIHLPPSPFSLTPVPPAPQYWETETAVGVGVKGGAYRWPTVMEIGVVEEDMMDSGWRVYDAPRSWCVKVGACDTHTCYCTQVWNQGKHLKCVRDTMSYTPGTSYTLRYGVVVDIVRGRVGFVDVDKGVVLEKMDVEFTQTIYPVFGLHPYPDDLTVEIRLISCSDVTMTEDKQKLINSCLTQILLESRDYNISHVEMDKF